MPSYDFNSTSLDIDVRISWGSGMVVDLGLSAVSALNGWTIEFEYDGEIVNIWNARIVSRDGNRYVIENMGYNGSVAAGQTTGFGFQGSGSATEIRPISINGETSDDTNPDPMPTVSVSDALASEEDGTVSFDISLSEASDQDVTITYETVAGSAQAGSDFVPQITQVVIPAGQTSVSVSVQLVNDTAQESTEQFELRLTSADGAEIADGTGLGQITDSDPGDTPPDPAPPVVSVADASANEGNPGDMGTGSSDPSPGTGAVDCGRTIVDIGQSDHRCERQLGPDPGRQLVRRRKRRARATRAVVPSDDRHDGSDGGRGVSTQSACRSRSRTSSRIRWRPVSPAIRALPG